MHLLAPKAHKSYYVGFHQRTTLWKVLLALYSSESKQMKRAIFKKPTSPKQLVISSFSFPTRRKVLFFPSGVLPEGVFLGTLKFCRGTFR